MIELTDSNYKEVLLEKSEGLILVDFWAEWCGPCKVLGPVFQRLSEKNPDVSFGKVNIDEVVEYTTLCGIRNIPTILFIKDGQVVDRTVGSVTETTIQEKINSHK
jgi:thioredoxin 1